MTDIVSRETRSRMMAGIRSKNTGPEMQVRHLCHEMGYRYRLHRADLPGKPDLVFPGRHSVIFVHGCFWHQHDCRYGMVRPKTNSAFWEKKRTANAKRDQRNLRDLETIEWKSLIVWECECRENPDGIRKKIREFLN